MLNRCVFSCLKTKEKRRKHYVQDKITTIVTKNTQATNRNEACIRLKKQIIKGVNNMQTAINTNNNIFIRADEVAMVLHVSVQTGYKIIRQLNEELQKKGLVVQTGRVNRRYFEVRYGISGMDFTGDGQIAPSCSSEGGI